MWLFARCGWCAAAIGRLCGATVLSAECPHAGYGCTVATVYYEYIVGGRKYGAAFEKPFIVQESGARFADGFVKGSELMVRVDPRDPCGDSSLLSASAAILVPPCRGQSKTALHVILRLFPGARALARVKAAATNSKSFGGFGGREGARTPDLLVANERI